MAPASTSSSLPSIQSPTGEAKTRDRKPFWGAERLLLVCLLGLGLIGLVMTYSDRVTDDEQTSRVEQDSLNQEGKLRETHMVLPLNQRQSNEQHSLRAASQL